MAEGIRTSYCEVIHYLLLSNETDDIVAEADTGIRKCSQLNKQTAEKFQKALWRKASRCGSFYSESELKIFSIEGLKNSIKNSVRHWWASNKEADIGELERHADFLSSLLGDHKSPKLIYNGQRRRRRGNGTARQDIMKLETKGDKKGFRPPRGCP